MKFLNCMLSVALSLAVFTLGAAARPLDPLPWPPVVTEIVGAVSSGITTTGDILAGGLLSDAGVVIGSVQSDADSLREGGVATIPKRQLQTKVQGGGDVDKVL
ncbi:hypothetical protein C8Q78DRAFT_1074813 [Trametes maxima]|nr:hypothetical protein C8Q78DRAFT_1074813 [Trametes maxima]